MQAVIEVPASVIRVLTAVGIRKFVKHRREGKSPRQAIREINRAEKADDRAREVRQRALFEEFTAKWAVMTPAQYAEQVDWPGYESRLLDTPEKERLTIFSRWGAKDVAEMKASYLAHWMTHGTPDFHKESVIKALERGYPASSEAVDAYGIGSNPPELLPERYRWI